MTERERLANKCADFARYFERKSKGAKTLVLTGIERRGLVEFLPEIVTFLRAEQAAVDRFFGRSDT